MSNKTELEKVNKYIECITSYLPTKEQIKFMEENEDFIMSNPHYRFLVRDALDTLEATNQLNYELENANNIKVEDIIPIHPVEGLFKIVQDKIEEVIHQHIDSLYKLNYTYDFIPVRGVSNDIEDNEISMDYDKKELCLYLYAKDQHHYMLEIEDEYYAPTYEELDQESNRYVYVFELDEDLLDKDIGVVYQD